MRDVMAVRSREAESSRVVVSVSMMRSAFSGMSNWLCLPVKLGISPLAALA